MILFKYVSIVVSLIVHGFTAVSAYPKGAPTSSCATITPVHGFQAQTRLSPFVTLSFRKMQEGTNLQVTLASPSKGIFFKGFMLMAFDTSDFDFEKPLGSFSADGEKAKAIDCLGGSGNAVTHVSSDNKTDVVTTWTPPKGYAGQVIFKTTFVQDLKTYWVRTESNVVSVLPNTGIIVPEKISSSANNLHLCGWTLMSLHAVMIVSFTLRFRFL